MRLIRYGIITGVIVLILYMAAARDMAKNGSLMLRRLYIDEALSSASIDALSFNEDIYGKEDPGKAMDRFYESMDCFSGTSLKIVCVIFLGREKLYYSNGPGNLIEMDYGGGSLTEDVSALLNRLYDTDLTAKPFIGNGVVLAKRSFIAVFDEAGEKLAGIGGAVRKRKKENRWNNH